MSILIFIFFVLIILGMIINMIEEVGCGGCLFGIIFFISLFGITWGVCKLFGIPV